MNSKKFGWLFYLFNYFHMAEFWRFCMRYRGTSNIANSYTQL